MIRITVSGTRLTLEGHANSDGYGHDLVCAAVSALTLTLAKNVKRLTRQGLAEDAVIQLQPGYGLICCRPKNKEAVKAVYAAIVTGYRLLGENYPQFVRVRIL